MNSFTLNKVAGAVLGTCLVGMGVQILAEAHYEAGRPTTPGYALPNPKPEEASAAEKKPEAAPIAVRLASADPKKGEADAKVCSACHNFQEGAGAKVGPGLYGVVDRPQGKMPGFDYSAGLAAKGGTWTYANLDEFITKPAAYISGTKMGYPGQDDPQKRANIIAYLRTLAKTPAALPQVTPADQAKVTASAPAKTTESTQAASDKSSGEASFLELVGSADPKKGQAASQVCAACHNFKKGAGSLIGPNLWDVVDRNKGSVAGYDYSEGLKKKGGTWSIDDLNAWLTKPSAYIAGTKMGYPGEANPKKRAQIIAYLRTLSDHPVALPGTAEGAVKADQDHSGVAKNMPPGAKPGDQSPPAPPNKSGVIQPAPLSPEPSEAAGAPVKAEVAQPDKPTPAPTPDEAKPAPAASAPPTPSTPPVPASPSKS